MQKAIFEMKPQQQRAADEVSVAGPNKNFGKVPAYLNKFKDQREEALK